MTINSTGPVSFGGNTVGQSINLELNQGAMVQVSLNDTNVRMLAMVTTPNSTIILPTNFYGKSNSPVVTLQSGIDYTSSAVYTAGGNSVWWWQITLGGTVTAINQSSTVSYSGRLGNKLFATYTSNNAVARSNYVGQYFWQDFTSANSKVTATVPATIPGVANGTGTNISSFNLVGYMWGGGGHTSNGSAGSGGYTDFVGPITSSSTIWVICAGPGSRYGGQDSSRDPDCKGKAYQGGWTDTGGGLSGVFTSDPLDGGNAPLLTPTSTAILGIAGGGGTTYSGGTGGAGGGSSGQSGFSGTVAGGGTQTGGGASAGGSVVRGADFMTGAVVSSGSSTSGGGGGYYGGGSTGGGGGTANAGGGSGYFRNSGGYTGQTITGNGNTVANTGSDYYPGGSVGRGSPSGDPGTGTRGQVRLYLR